MESEIFKIILSYKCIRYGYFWNLYIRGVKDYTSCDWRMFDRFEYYSSDFSDLIWMMRDGYSPRYYCEIEI